MINIFYYDDERKIHLYTKYRHQRETFMQVYDNELPEDWSTNEPNTTIQLDNYWLDDETVKDGRQLMTYKQTGNFWPKKPLATPDFPTILTN